MSRARSLLGEQGRGGYRKSRQNFSTPPGNRTRALSVVSRVCYHCTTELRPPPYAKDIAKLGVRRRATKMIPSLRNKLYEERLSHLSLFSPEKRRLKGKLIACFKILNDFTNVDPTKLFEKDDLTRKRNSEALNSHADKFIQNA